MKVLKVTKLTEKFTQYDISTAFENFYVKTNTGYVLIHNSPAIIIGIDPSDKQFFVAKKSVFNKNPKVYKSNADIDADTEGDLAVKLKIALKNFKQLGIKSGVIQGDLMYTKSDLKTEIIDGNKYITFHPNTIVYAVPYDSDLGKKIRSSEIGVVWHTTYTGNSFETMSASFGKDIVSTLNNIPSVWQDDATYKDYSGIATFTGVENQQVTEMLTGINTLYKQINKPALDYISNDSDLLALIMTYNNSKIRAGQLVTDVPKHVSGLYQYIHDKYQKEIDAKKTDKGKQTWVDKRQKVLSFFDKHEQSEITKIFELSKLIGLVKQPIIEKMNKAASIKTFLKTSDGFKVTGVEGFVAIDTLSNQAVKIVDRMEFSKANFSPEILKGWQR